MDAILNPGPFRTSDGTDKIDEAFARAQLKFKTAVKNAANPHFKSRFADYEALIDAGRDALNEEGIAVLQPATAKGQAATVTTTLRFKGQWYASDLEMTATQAGPQALGSCISYAKRYALAAMLAIPSGDDDGEAAEGRQTETVRDPPKAAPATNVDKVKQKVAAANGKPDPARQILGEAIVALGNEPDARAFLKAQRGDKAGTPVSEDEIPGLRAALEKRKQQQKNVNDAAGILSAQH